MADRDYGYEWYQWVRSRRDEEFSSFDKLLVGIGAGALTLSIGFVRELLPERQSAVASAWVFAGWLCLVGCLVVAAVGHLFSAQAHTLALHADAIELEDPEESTALGERSDWWSRLTGGANVLAVTLLAVGLGLIAYFAYKNLG